MRMILFSAAVVVLIASFACGNAEEKAAEQVVEETIEADLGGDAGVEISEEGMEITSQDENGTYTWKAGDKAEIPDSFPQDVYIFEGATVVMVSESPDSFVVALTTDAAVSAVADSYLEEMTSAGWSKLMETDMDDGRMLVFGMGDRSVNVGVFPEDGMTGISLSVGN